MQLENLITIFDPGNNAKYPLSQKQFSNIYIYKIFFLISRPKEIDKHLAKKIICDPEQRPRMRQSNFIYLSDGSTMYKTIKRKT